MHKYIDIQCNLYIQISFFCRSFLVKAAVF